MAFCNPAMKKTRNSSTDSKLNMPTSKKRRLGVRTGGNNLPEAKPKNAEEPHKKFAFYAQKCFQPMKIWTPPLKMNTGTANQCDVEEANKENSTANITKETSDYEENRLFLDDTRVEDRNKQEKLSTRPCVAEDQLHCIMNTYEQDLEIREFSQQNFDSNQNFGDTEKQNQFKKDNIEREIVSSNQSSQNTTKTFSEDSKDKEVSEHIQENQIKYENGQILKLEEKEFQENIQESQVDNDKILKLKKKEFQDQLKENQIKYGRDQILEHEKKEFQEKAQESQVTSTIDELPFLKSTYSQEEYERDKLNTAPKMTKVSWQSDGEADTVKKMNNFSVNNNIENLTKVESNFSESVSDQNHKKTDDFKIKLQDKKLSLTDFNDEKPDDAFNKETQNGDSASVRDTQQILQNDEEATIDENCTTKELSSDDDLDNYISKTIEKYMNKDKLKATLKDLKSLKELSDSSQETVILPPEKIQKPELQTNKEDHLNHLCGEEVKSNGRNESKVSVKFSSYDSKKGSCLEDGFSNKATYLVESNTCQWKNDATKNPENVLVTRETKPTVLSDFKNYVELDANETSVLEQEDELKFLENHLDDAGCHKENSKETKTNNLQKISIDLIESSTLEFKELDGNKKNTCFKDTKLNKDELGNVSNLGIANLNRIKMLYQNLELLKSKETEKKQQNLENQKETQQNSFQNGLMTKSNKHEEKIDSEDVTKINVVTTNNRDNRKLSLTIMTKEQECSQQSVTESASKSEVKTEKNSFSKIFEKTSCDNKVPNKINICGDADDMSQHSNPFYLKTKISNRSQPSHFLQQNEKSNKPDMTKECAQPSVMETFLKSKVKTENISFQKINEETSFDNKVPNRINICGDADDLSLHSNPFYLKSKIVNKLQPGHYLRQNEKSNKPEMTKDCAQPSLMETFLKSKVKTENISFSKITDETSCDDKVPNRINICGDEDDLTQHSNPFYLKAKISNRSQPSHFLQQSANKPEVTKEKFFRTFTELYENKCLIGNNLIAITDREPFDNRYLKEKVLVSPGIKLGIRNQYPLRMSQNDKNQRVDDVQRRKMGDVQEIGWTSTSVTRKIKSQKRDCDRKFSLLEMDFKGTELSNLHSPLEQPSISNHVELSLKTNYLNSFHQTSSCHALEFPQRTHEKPSLQTNKESLPQQNQVKIQERLYFLKELIDQSKMEREKKTDSIRDVLSETNTLVNNLIDSIKKTKH